MHYILLMIVEADTAEQAMTKSEKGFDDLIANDNGGWDYYTIFESDEDDPTERTMSGTARFGRRNNPTNFIDGDGWELIRKFQDYMKEDFVDNMDDIRRILNTHTSKEIFENLGNWQYKRDGVDDEICNICKGQTYKGCWNIMMSFSSSEMEYDLGNNRVFGLKEYEDGSVWVRNLYNDHKFREWANGKEMERIWIVQADMHR